MQRRRCATHIALANTHLTRLHVSPTPPAPPRQKNLPTIKKLDKSIEGLEKIDHHIDKIKVLTKEAKDTTTQVAVEMGGGAVQQHHPIDIKVPPSHTYMLTPPPLPFPCAHKFCMCCVQGEVCGICKVEAKLIYPGSKDSAVLKCGHVFHNTCLRPHDAKHGTCPVCRNVTGDPMVLEVQGGDGCVVLTCMKCGECAGDGDQLAKCTIRTCDKAIHQYCNYKDITDKQYYDNTCAAPLFWCDEHKANHKSGFDVRLKPATAPVSGSQDRAERLQRREEAREERRRKAVKACRKHKRKRSLKAKSKGKKKRS